MLFEDPEMNRIFTEQVKADDKSNIMGTIEYVKQEAEEKGRMKKEASVVLNLLTQTNFSDEKIADLVGVSVAFVEEVRKSKK